MIFLQYLYKSVMDEFHVEISDYLPNHPELNREMRQILFEWLINVCEDYDNNDDGNLNMHYVERIYYLAFRYIDMFLTNVRHVAKSRFQLVGMVALFIASKYIIDGDYNFIQSSFLVEMSNNTYSHEEIIRLEMEMLIQLKFCLRVDDPYEILQNLDPNRESETYNNEYDILNALFMVYPLRNYKSKDLVIGAIYIYRICESEDPYKDNLVSLTGLSKLEISILGENIKIVLESEKT